MPNKITYSRTINLGDYSSERIELSVEYEESPDLTNDSVFAEVKGKVMGWVEAPESQPTIVKTPSRPVAKTPQKASTTNTYWCDLHKTDFFMRGNMSGFAHPVEGEYKENGKEAWCNREEYLEKQQEKGWEALSDQRETASKGSGAVRHTPEQTKQYNEDLFGPSKS